MNTTSSVNLQSNSESFNNIRHASINDLNFIFDLVMAGSKKSHFASDFYNIPAASAGLLENLKSILVKRQRLDSPLVAYAVILEDKKQPVSFMIISAVDGKGGNEIWMMATAPDKQRQGFATTLLQEVLKQFKQANKVVQARCSPASEIMYQLLINNGFKLFLVGKEGIRNLVFNF